MPPSTEVYRPKPSFEFVWPQTRKSSAGNVQTSRLRAPHRRRRTGCITCKSLHRRCDEQKPQCMRCLNANRICGGYVTSQLGNTPRPKFRGFRNLTLSAFVDPRDYIHRWTDTERQSFEFFALQTSQVLAYHHFDGLVNELLSAATSHESLAQCCVALGALHLARAGGSIVSDDLSKHSFTFKQYAKAITLLREHINTNRSMKVVQLACVLIVIYESMLGRTREFDTHLQHGLALIESSKDTADNADGAGRFLVTVDFLQALYNRPRKPFSWARVVDRLPQPVNTQPLDVLDAQGGLGSISLAVLFFTTQISSNYFGDAVAEARAASRLRNTIKQWWCSVRALQSHPAQSGAVLDYKRFHVGYLMTMIYLEASSFRSPLAFDMYSARYEQVISSTEEIVSQLKLSASSFTGPLAFSVDLGLIATTFFVIITCRMPSLRRRAIDLLSRVPRIEGPWDADLITRVAGVVVEQEELRAKRLGFKLCEDHDSQFGIPQSCRVQEVDIVDSSPSEQQFLKMVVLRWCWMDEFGQFGITYHNV